MVLRVHHLPVAVIVIPVLLGLITFRRRDVNAADDTDIETQLGRSRLRSVRTLVIVWTVQLTASQSCVTPVVGGGHDLVAGALKS